jgi:hypothetical protein
MTIDNILEIWLIVFFFDSLRYLLGAGSVALVLYWLLRQFSESRRIQTRRAKPADIQREVSFSLLTTAVYALVAVFTVQLKRRLHYPLQRP